MHAWLRNFAGLTRKLFSLSLQRNWIRGRRTAAGGGRSEEDSDGVRRKRMNGIDLLKGDYRRPGREERKLRRIDGMRGAGAMAAVAESAFGLFHCLPHAMEIIAGRDYGKEQNQDTAERTHEDERPARRTARRNLLPPQRIRGQHEGEPAKIKKKLHPNR
jgi:hypothetical protein